MKSPRVLPILTTALLSLATAVARPADVPADPLAWPGITREARPGAYWWWMGSAVDATNLTRELTRYRDAGMGGVHVIPIYGAKGWEDRALEYLSPRWLEMLRHTVSEADRLGLTVDVTTGSGWCFGGPRVTDAEANASVVWQIWEVEAGGCLLEQPDPASVQTLMAFRADGASTNLTRCLRPDGAVDWVAEGGPWRIYAVSQRPSGQRVKRAAPGGQGHMLNLIHPPAITNYLRWFDEAFAGYAGPKPRAQYHDSYEYRSDWAPGLLSEFERRRGYRLQDEFPALFANAQPPRARGEPAPNAPPPVGVDPDHAARVKSDYRETVSDILAETTLPAWAGWSRRHGFLTRNEAHGSPGNWLDLYAVADIPETEMFNRDRNKLISKFASSAAHVAGRRLVAAETGTWLREHFTETLADLKYLLDDLFLSGVNHIFYHGTCYSPDEAPWPGWLFYASTELNPRNSIWRDVPALNAYAARCQSVLQSGQPDADILLYWPIHDFWHSATGLVRNLTVHARDWFEDQPVGRTAATLWGRGYAFDFVSDRQLGQARAEGGAIRVPGGGYRCVVVPPCQRMPLPTLEHLLALAEAGATVVFEGGLPADVPGWHDLAARRARLGELRQRPAPPPPGRRLTGPATEVLAAAGCPREPLFDHPGLMGLRRALPDGHYYFIANRSPDTAVRDWIPLGRPARGVVLLDPLSGRTGVAAWRRGDAGNPAVRLHLEPGESVILRTTTDRTVAGPAWRYPEPAGEGRQLAGLWRVRFLAGGPELPAAFATRELSSWTEQGDTNAHRFAGTAVYALTFDRPAGAAAAWWLELGRVCQSARVRLNGRDLGTWFTPPFRGVVAGLQPTGNELEVEVTNVAANRIRDLDRRGVAWKTFLDINFVNLDYQPFDASGWPPAASGLLGPVRLTPLAPP